MNITDIQKHVTYFSEQLRSAEHTEEVVIGGKINDILPPVNEEYPMYVVILDDFIGSSHVYVPDTMFQAFSDDFQVGNMVFLEGFVNVVSSYVSGKIVKETSVIAYGMKDITKEKETT